MTAGKWELGARVVYDMWAPPARVESGEAGMQGADSLDAPGRGPRSRGTRGREG